MERLGSSALQELPEKIRLLITDHVQNEHDRQYKVKEGYYGFFQ